MKLASAVNVDRICLLLEEEGYRARLEPHDGDMYSIVSGAHGETFRIFVSIKNGAIGHITFSLFRSADEVEVALRKLNEFNNDSLFARAFKDSDDDLTVKGTVHLVADELTDDIFHRYFAYFQHDVELALNKLL